MERAGKQNQNRITEGRAHIGPKKAQEILTACAYPKQRKVYPHHVEFLKGVMLRGGWNVGSQLAFARLEGRLTLVNGYHRLHAIIGADQTQEFQLLIIDVDNPADIDHLYSRFDTGSRPRTTAELLNAIDFSKNTGLGKLVSSRLLAAAALIENGFKRVNAYELPESKDIDFRILAAKKWAVPAATYEDLVRLADKHIKRKLFTASVMSVALTTVLHQPSSAAVFWKGVAEDDGLRKGDPRKALSLYLIRTPLGVKEIDLTIKAAALAWNAHFLGKPLNFLRPGAAIFSVLGAPWKRS